MPVPVPRHSKPPAHPVIKPANRALGQQLPSYATPGALLVPHSGLPPSFAQREDWPGALPSWRRNSQRPIWDQDAQDFRSGLAAADNASVIKGTHAEACIPPMENRAQLPAPPPGIYPRHYAFDSNTGAGQGVMELLQFETRKIWEDSSRATYDGVDMHGENRYHHRDSSPQDAAFDAARSSHLGVFTPILEDQSPGSGPGSGSSPLEPLTPFCDYIDRAVAAAHTAIQYEDRGIYQDTQAVPSACAPPVFPSIAEQPQQDPITDTVTPITTVDYKKLTEPLSEWMANYVWKVCTTGYSLPPAFAQPSTNAGPYAVAAPSYLAPAIHALLLSTLLQPSAVFLALWYIVRLPVYFGGAALGAEFAKESSFRAALMGDAYVGYEREASENSAPFRIVVLGCMLANKWLDDHTFSNKTWHSISNIPVQTLNALESHALNVFSYDLSISNQQWSQWLSHVMTYHQSLASSNRPQPISRPSANPHAIVRRALEEIIQARVVCNSPELPQPVFLGLEERLRERAQKEEAMAMDVLEIDLDEDGPLREQYLPKRRASKLGSQNTHSRDVSVGEKWNGPDAAPAKMLPPPAKWSPAGDEPILRDRNRSSGHYVAVQAPPIATAAYSVNCQPQEMAFNQNWNPPMPAAAAYMPVKSQPGYVYDLQTLVRANQPSYNPFGFITPISLPRSRSHSVSYGHDSLLSRNHMRSYSQARFDYQCSDLRMTAGEHVPIPEVESRWMEAAGHYPYSGPAFVPLQGMQPTW
ncbi:hypothetical protein NLJ89_g1275 [Agrocybe chaxingu]|uniref:Cyclin N-terminal domain-containing protein n=1 Tax=Agrocybe chaxingu TaxID=84603 RepID=A0A9W8TFH6_9AGAR|nr:hypothetical protein NLJ89_g1275 [Agrocybe chaxingu]